jgi:hypothetical protein
MHKKEMNFAFFYVSCASLWPFNDSFAPIRVLLRFKPLFKDKPLILCLLRLFVAIENKPAIQNSEEPNLL